MKRLFLKVIRLAMILLAVALSICCKRELSIEQPPDHTFKVELAPVKKNIQKGESVSLQFSVIYKKYDGAAFKFRYFQPEGKGALANNTEPVQMNTEYTIPADGKINLQYTSDSDIPQTLEFVFTDKFGSTKKHTILFDPEAIPDYGFKVEMEPVKPVIRTKEQIALKFKVSPNEPYEDAAYTFRYVMTRGSAELRLPGLGLLEANQSYDIPQNGMITVNYTSTCHELQEPKFTFEDKLGNQVERSLNFEDMPYPYFGIIAPEYVTYPMVGDKRVNITFAITGIENYEVKEFKFYFRRPYGRGILSNSEGTTLLQDYLYPIPANGQFTLTYRQAYNSTPDDLDFFIQDTYGNELKHSMTVY